MRSHPRSIVPASALALVLLSVSVEAHDVRVRRPLRVPNVPGFLTLQCDFHTHTVFSDGTVWPDIRSEEAWREGYDAIAITDHIEYQPHREDLPTNHERSWEIAAPHGEKLGVIVIRGSEITRKMPPGHLNAIFLTSVCPLETPDWRDALRAARAQGAFVFWNHPGWRGQQKDGVARWYPEHTEILENGLLDGIEVVNDREYYPEAHRVGAREGPHDPRQLRHPRPGEPRLARFRGRPPSGDARLREGAKRGGASRGALRAADGRLVGDRRSSGARSCCARSSRPR